MFCSQFSFFTLLRVVLLNNNEKLQFVVSTVLAAVTEKKTKIFDRFFQQEKNIARAVLTVSQILSSMFVL